MLPRENRLKNSDEIRQVFKLGRIKRSGFLFLKYQKNPDVQASRVAFSVGINFSKKAPERTKAKRVLRESFRKYIFDVRPGFDMVVFPTKQARVDDFTASKTQSAVKELLHQANLILINKKQK